MPKLSIYVQDDLWNRARAVEPDLNSSQLVQTAIRRYVDEGVSSRPAFARERPAGAEAAAIQLRAKFVEEARTHYLAGYEAGLNWAQSIPLSVIEEFADARWDFMLWVKRLDAAEPQRDGLEVVDASNELTEMLGDVNPGPVWRLGFTDALRGLWTSVMEERPVSPEARPLTLKS